jgi:hypothetical protein
MAETWYKPRGGNGSIAGNKSFGRTNRGLPVGQEEISHESN